MYMKEIFPFDVKLLKRDEDKFGRTPCKTIKIKGTIKISRPLRLVIPFQREFLQRYHTISLDYKIQFTNIYILWIIKYYDIAPCLRNLKKAIVWYIWTITQPTIHASQKIQNDISF